MPSNHSPQERNPPPSQLISASAIATRIAELGREIATALPCGPIVLVGVLRGAFIFMADLARALPLDVRCDFLATRSYGAATETSGVVAIASDLAAPIAGKHVLLVEDIVDTGLTLKYLLQTLKARAPASVHACALLNKPSRRRVQVPLDFYGFEIPDVFVVGYGLDFDQRYRNLPYVGVLPQKLESTP